METTGWKSPDSECFDDCTSVESFSFYVHFCRSALSVVFVGDGIVPVLLKLLVAEHYGNGRLFCMAVIFTGRLRERHVSVLNFPGILFYGREFYRDASIDSGREAHLRHLAARHRGYNTLRKNGNDRNLCQKEED